MKYQISNTLKSKSEAKSLKILGPFDQIITLNDLPPKGHIKDSELEIINDGGVAVQGDHIVALGRYEEIRKLGGILYEIDFPAVALPSFVDSHTHICYAGSRAFEYAKHLDGMSYQEIARQGGGILYTVEQTRAASLEQLVDLTVGRAKLLLSRGVTTAEVKSGYGLNVKDEVKMLEAIRMASLKQPVELIPTCLAAHIKPPEFNSKSEYLLFLIQNLLPILKQENLSKRIDIFIDSGAFTVEEARAYLTVAKGLDFTLTIHADQFVRGGAKLASELHVLSADHLEQCTEEDAKILSQSNVIPIVLPGSSLCLGIPFAPAKLLLDNHLPLVIASNWNPGTAPMGDLLTEASLLGAAQRLTMSETLAAMTIRAAKALELYDRGYLAPKTRADINVFPTHDYREILYNQGSLKPRQVFAKGELVLSQNNA
jgi:imidazolonepropionase